LLPGDGLGTVVGRCGSEKGTLTGPGGGSVATSEPFLACFYSVQAADTSVVGDGLAARWRFFPSSVGGQFCSMGESHCRTKEHAERKGKGKKNRLCEGGPRTGCERPGFQALRHRGPNAWHTFLMRLYVRLKSVVWSPEGSG